MYEPPRVVAEGEGWSLAPALIEIGVMGPQRGRTNGVGLEIRVDGSLYAGGQADGMLAATPAGSTAYDRSEGSPLVHPTADALVLTETCARSPMPSLVLGADSDATVRRASEPLRVAGPPLDLFAALGGLDRGRSRRIAGRNRAGAPPVS